MTVWCVEDDSDILNMELYTLKSTGFSAEGFSDGAALFKALETQKPDILILDVMLPGEDGTEILGKLKKSQITADLPVIMATAKGAEYDKIRSLDLGADDYLVKPFGMMEMVSRIKAVLRRCSNTVKKAAIKFGDLALDPESRSVTVCSHAIELTYKEFEILKLFLEHPGTVFTRDRLFSEVWGEDYVGETRTVDMHIRTLRKKLGVCAEYITTVRNVGYRIEVPAK